MLVPQDEAALVLALAQPYLHWLNLHVFGVVKHLLLVVAA